MNRVKYSILTIFGIIILAGSIFSTSKPVSAATIQDMKNKFPNGAYWNHVVKSGHRYSNYQDQGSCNNPDGYTWTPCDTHKGNVGVGGHDCNSFQNAMQCCGFAKKLAYDLYGSTHVSWGTTTLANAKIGDVMHYKGAGADATNGHWVMIIGKNGNTLTFGECNVGSNCKISWGRTLDISRVSSYTIYSAPWAASLGGGSSVPSTTITFQDQNINHTWDTNAEVYVKIMNPGKQTVSKVGCYLYDESGTLLKSYSEDCNLSTSYVNYNCNFNNDMKYTLKPGTTYKYVAYAIVNGTEYKDSGRSFKTTGSSDTSAPVISDVSVGIFNGDSYEVRCKVTDNVGVARVQFPTWTVENGQDDIIPDWTTNSKASGTLGEDGYYTYKVNLSEHNNETGIYVTHIYAYDAAGNQSTAVAPDVNIPKYCLYFLNSGIDAVQGKDACILEARITLNDAVEFTSAKMITKVEKDGKTITQEKDLGSFTTKENSYYYFEQLVDRRDFENAEGTYTTTCILVDAEGETTQASVQYDMAQLQNNLYMKATVGDELNLKEASGLTEDGWAYSMNQYYQKDIFCYVSEKSSGTITCNKAGRVYIIWENSVSGEKYLQILDISEKPVSGQEQTQGSAQTGTQTGTQNGGQSQKPGNSGNKTTVSSNVKKGSSGSNAGTSVNNNVRSVVVRPPAKVRGVTLRAKKKALTAGWWYTSGSSGYQVVCSRSRKFTGKKTAYTKNISVKIRGLKRKKTYYVKVRAYVVNNGKRVYGKWSSVKKCRVK